MTTIDPEILDNYGIREGTLAVYAMRGLPAAGKTTIARQLCKAHGDMVLIGRNFLRDMFFFDPRPGDQAELMVHNAVRSLVYLAVKRHQRSVILDDCHVDTRSLKFGKHLAADLGVPFRDVPIRTPIDECIRRDALRQEQGKRFVGAHVIEDMYERANLAVLADVDQEIIRDRLPEPEL